jgi:dihydroxycyclohexadiene carboxylate dehydrogenase
MSEAAGRFVGKIGIVTGAAQGIGKAVALRMAREGGTVVLVDRSELVREVTEQIENDGGQAVAVIADLERYAGATMTVDVARQRFGKIDILLNNVGGTIWAMPYTEYAEHQIEAEIRRSLFPTLWCCRAVLPVMLSAGGGAIVNVTSIATRGINRVPYTAAKGGVNAITACLAFEYAQYGIRVCGVAPAGIDAPPRRIPRSLGEVSEEEQKWFRQVMEQTVSSALMKRLGTLEEEWQRRQR